MTIATKCKNTKYVPDEMVATFSKHEMQVLDEAAAILEELGEAFREAQKAKLMGFTIAEDENEVHSTVSDLGAIHDVTAALRAVTII